MEETERQARIREDFQTARGRLALIGALIIVGVAITFPYDAAGRSGSVRTASIALTALAAAIAFVVSTSTDRTQVRVWVGLFAALSLGAIWVSNDVRSGGPGSYGLSYAGLAFVWSIGLLSRRPLLLPSICPLIVLQPWAFAESPVDFFARFGFGFVAVGVATWSLSSYLRRIEEDLDDGARHPSLSDAAEQRLRRAWSRHTDHAPYCQPSAPPVRTHFGSEYLLLLRRRGLDNQFTEWRVRTQFGDALYVVNEAEDDALQALNDEILGPENSPLSLLVYESDEGAHIVAKAAFSALSPADLHDQHRPRLEIRNLRLGRVARRTVPRTSISVGSGGADAANTPFLNDLVGGGVSGDNHRFALALLWMMFLHPVSVIAQRLVLDRAPGRLDVNGGLVTAASLMMALAALLFIVTLRRDETVITRLSWHSIACALFLVPAIAYAALDNSGSFWAAGGRTGFRFVHPFLLEALLLCVLVGTWAPQSPRRRARASTDAETLRAELNTPRAETAYAVWRAVSVSLFACATAFAVSLLLAAMKADDLRLDPFLEQLSAWLVPCAAATAAGSIATRLLFAATNERTFKIQSWLAEPSSIDETLALLGCDTYCPLAERARAIATALAIPERGRTVAALAMLGGFQRAAVADGARLLYLDRVPGLVDTAVLDRVLLVSGHHVSTRAQLEDGSLIVGFIDEDTLRLQRLSERFLFASRPIRRDQRSVR